MPASTWNYLPTEKGQKVTKSGKDCRLQLNPPQESWSQGRFSSTFSSPPLLPPWFLPNFLPAPAYALGNTIQSSLRMYAAGQETGRFVTLKKVDPSIV